MSENDTDFWIGAKANVSKSHVYYWPDGTSVASGFNHWQGVMMGQPDDRRTKNEDCVYLNDKDMYFWHDDQCSAKKTGYICEIWNVTDKSISNLVFCLIVLFCPWFLFKSTVFGIRLKILPHRAFLELCIMSIQIFLDVHLLVTLFVPCYEMAICIKRCFCTSVSDSVCPFVCRTNCSKGILWTH